MTLPEFQIENQTPANASNTETSLLLLSDTQEKFPVGLTQRIEATATKPSPPPPSEITVWEGKQPFSVSLPGQCQFVSGPFGLSQTISLQNSENPNAPLEQVSVSSAGKLTFHASDPKGLFSVKQQGDQQIVTTPSGNQVIVQNGRIIEAVTGGHRTEFLTPKEAEDRQKERERVRELKMEAWLTSNANDLANMLKKGNVPVEQLQYAFATADQDYGTYGTARLLEAINRNLENSDTRLSAVDNSRARPPYYGDQYSRNIELTVTTWAPRNALPEPKREVSSTTKISVRLYGLVSYGAAFTGDTGK